MYSIGAPSTSSPRRRHPLGPSPIASTFHQHEMRDAAMAQAFCRESTTPPTNLTPLVSKLGGGGGLNRTKSHFSFSSNLSLSSDASSSSIESSTFFEDSSEFDVSPTSEQDYFALDMRRYIGSSPHAPSFSSSELRKVMEPHLRRARLLREKSRRTSHLKVDASIASSIGVPYTTLREERPFIFDEHAYPLHSILASTLNVEDLSQVHQIDEEDLFQPLLDRDRRHAFHLAYDAFVTSFCIPLLHSMAITKQIFQHSMSDHRITYRYQAFPTIQVSRPGCTQGSAPECDTILGHSIGCLTFHVPLTPCQGTNCLFSESHPGKEDWHALEAKSGVGLGYLFDGARCLHFNLENTTDVSAVSLTFRVLIYREGCDLSSSSSSSSSTLCPPALLDDAFSRAGPGYYEEAVIDLSSISTLGSQAVIKKKGNRLIEPDHRFGYPFL